MYQRYLSRLIIVGLLISAGIGLEASDMLNVEEILGIARAYSSQWWLIVVLIVLQTVFFTFALAGSVFLWVVAPLYAPPVATFILVTGGVLGGLGAYLFSRRLTDDWIAKVESSHTYRMLHNRNNFFTLFAMRVFPAFPHSLINYSSGILKVRLSHFLVAAIVGISIKSYVYANVIYNAAGMASIKDMMNPSIYAPLVLISVVAVIFAWINPLK